jgi:hypothetical protein
MGGDASVMRALLDRLIAPRKDRPVSIAMPKINTASDLIAAAAALISAVSDGEITPGEAASLSTLVANTAKAVETFELDDRLARLEEQMAAKGNTLEPTGAPRGREAYGNAGTGPSDFAAGCWWDNGQGAQPRRNHHATCPATVR